MRVDVMEVDAAQYAEMSWEMLTTHSYLQLHNLGRDYLDKPPLLFWLSSLSFSVFGIGNFTYKLPSLLFAALAVFSTYRFARLYYDEKVARLSALMLATTQAVFLITNDVRTDTLLMGAVMFSIWQWAAFTEHPKWKHVVWGSIGLGLALLAKGPIGLIATVAAIGPHVLWKRKLKVFFDIRILTVFILVALLLLPMCIGLYRQFGVEGLKFYFWTQSFGRITGESEWNNHPDTFFLVHTTAWAILPWTLFFFWGWLKGIYDLIKMRFVSWSRIEFITLSGFTLVLIALSLSKYQLPHYIFVVLPLACVIAAKSFDELPQVGKIWKTVFILHALLVILLFAVAIFLCYAFSQHNILAIASLVAFFIFCVAILFWNKDILLISVAGMLLFNFYLSAFFFPALLKYQPENDFGRYAAAHTNAGTAFLSYKFIVNYSLVFYARQIPPPTIWAVDDLKAALNSNKQLLLISTEQGLAEIKEAPLNYRIIEVRSAYKVARLNWKFLNPTTREQSCEKLYLLEATL